MTIDISGVKYVSKNSTQRISILAFEAANSEIMPDPYRHQNTQLEEKKGPESLVDSQIDNTSKLVFRIAYRDPQNVMSDSEVACLSKTDPPLIVGRRRSRAGMVAAPTL